MSGWVSVGLAGELLLSVRRHIYVTPRMRRLRAGTSLRRPSRCARERRPASTGSCHQFALKRSHARNFLHARRQAKDTEFVEELVARI